MATKSKKHLLRRKPPTDGAEDNHIGIDKGVGHAVHDKCCV